MTKDRKPLGLLALIAVSLILVSALVAVNVDARGANANGRKGGGGGGASPPTVTLTVSPNPVPVGSYATITGSGFTPGATINWNLGGGVIVGMADSNGIASVSLRTYSTGTVTISAYQFVGGSWAFAGSITFNIV